MTGLDGLGREVSRPLRDEPLDVVATGLKVLMDRGLVHGVTMESGRKAWGLTVKGRTRLAGEAKP